MEQLDLQDYLDASSDASSRTRVVTITLVVASVLIFAGFLNSLDGNWMFQRVRKMADPQSEYTKLTIGANPGDTSESKAVYLEQYKAFYGAMVRSYVDNTFTIRVPFFGITFDVNDLGLLGGLAFIIILILFRFSLSREKENLVLSFEEAKREKALPIFYNLLAMRQVLTSPPTGQRSRFNEIMPKTLLTLPVLVHLLVVINDFRTYNVGVAIDVVHTVGLFVSNSVLWVLILLLSFSCLRVWLGIDEIWNKYWQEVQTINTVRPINALGQSNLTA